MVAPNSDAETLDAFRKNFCAAGEPPHRTLEAGELSRTAQVQPGVYFTLEAPFVRILGLYSNCLEDPGVISTQGGTFSELSDAQLVFLKTALQRIKTEKFVGAVVIAVHHPPYVAQIAVTARKSLNVGRHGGSPMMLGEIDAACQATGIWPHAVLSGHATIIRGLHVSNKGERHRSSFAGMEVTLIKALHGVRRLRFAFPSISRPFRAMETQ